MAFVSQHTWTGFLNPRSLSALALSFGVGLQASCTSPLYDESATTGGFTSRAPVGSGTASTATDGSASEEKGPGDSSSDDEGTEDGPVCASDLDCTDPSLPACDQRLGMCVRCTRSADHCQDPQFPLCGMVNGIPSCEACFSDNDCRSGGRGNFCLKDDREGADPPHRCVECINDDSCSDPSRPRCAVQSGDYQCKSCNAVLGQCPGDHSCLLMGEDTGRCTEAVIYVQESSDCESKTGSQDSPFCTVMDAMRAVEKNTPTTIRLAAGDSTMIGLMVPAGLQVSIVGQEDFNPQLMIEDGTQLSLHGVRMQGGLVVRGGSKVRLSAIESGGTWGIALAGQSEMWMERSVFASDASRLGTPPVIVEDSIMHIGSSVIAGHKVGSDDPERDGLALFGLKGASMLLLDHVTIANNDLETKAPIFRCKDRRSSVTIENSIVLDLRLSSQMRCTNTQLSAIRVISDLPELTTDQGLLWTQIAWKDYFRNPNENDFGLGPGYKNSGDPLRKAIRELGQWQPGQSAWDLDGEPWAPGKGFVGADQAER